MRREINIKDNHLFQARSFIKQQILPGKRVVVYYKQLRTVLSDIKSLHQDLRLLQGDLISMIRCMQISCDCNNDQLAELSGLNKNRISSLLYGNNNSLWTALLLLLRKLGVEVSMWVENNE